ncbi:hypothetical protein Pmani_002245 [Petrolisthes manimaculis]|uniref:Uncharacterized protein n=1 Tax=Petrolisthes manimaculis TaxID=1843537 RepID=A0AAE1UR78_9EUCA|nr:hypothetical protein Pmani_002245 [Petrolisthes manimaculis]
MTFLLVSTAQLRFDDDTLIFLAAWYNLARVGCARRSGRQVRQKMRPVDRYGHEKMLLVKSIISLLFSCPILASLNRISGDESEMKNVAVAVAVAKVEWGLSCSLLLVIDGNNSPAAVTKVSATTHKNTLTLLLQSQCYSSWSVPMLRT